MADIFISYSKQDQDEARLLAAFLEAEGYSVWWDTTLISGENFRKTIMTELGRARVAIVIWTESSIHSDWVQSEAGRAHADRKLIPVKAKGLAYKDIPPPFDNMHIEELGQREKILGAVVAQLAKPEVQAGAIQRFTKQARFTLFSWFGIGGAVVTLSSNLQGLLSLAKWIRHLFESWAVLLKAVWGAVFFFVPKIYGTDAVFLTLMAFALVNLLMSSRRRDSGPYPRGSLSSIIIASSIVIIVLAIGLVTLADEEMESTQGYYSALLGTIFDLESLKGNWFVQLVVLLAIAVLIGIVIPLTPVALFYWSISRAFSLRLSTDALSRRLWRIVAGIGFVIAINYLSIWIEGQPWAARFMP